MAVLDNNESDWRLTIKKFTLFVLLVLLMIVGLFREEVSAWGWETHRYINEHAVDCLPSEMANFRDQREYLRVHSVDPDQSDLPGYYHYIDIDNYSAFFQGTLPHDFDTMVDQYGYSVVTNNGTVPWVITDWADSLSHLMEREQWDGAWQVAAELGHYIADSHQPLHLTKNYNGWDTGNGGIHSRYESHMINDHLSEVVPPDSTANYWDDVTDSVFAYIDDLNPYVDDIMAADDAASESDPSYGSTYYSLLWDELDSLTTDAIDRAVVDLAAVWYSAWLNTGNTTSIGAEHNNNIRAFTLHQNYPNPFNPETQIAYSLSEPSNVRLQIYDAAGILVKTMYAGYLTPGTHTIRWDGTDRFGSRVSTGVYFYRLKAGDFVEVKKMVYLK